METTTDSAWSADELHALADVLAQVDPAALPVDLLDQLDALERLKSAAAAAQVVIAAAFADAVEAAEDAPAEGRRRPPRAMSIGAEVAATRTSPYQGEQRVLLSRRLRDHLPGVHSALGRGETTEERAFAVARAVAHLDPGQRRRVDDDLAGRADLATLGDEKLRLAVRRSCLSAAPEAEERRHRRARADRAGRTGSSTGRSVRTRCTG